jgi:glycosyltransferase involved in cell wall biosynthesis
MLGRLADEITAVCEFSATSLADNDGFPRRRIAVIPNGIDLDRYSAVDDRPHLRARLGLAMDRQYIVIVARFHPVKDHATLLRAFATLADQRTGVDLLLVGDGPLRQALERQIDELNIRPRVHLLGVRSDVADLLRASDIFVLSSVSEAASITLLESKACGLPAVVTDVGGNPELVRDHVDGLLVPRGDAERLAQALLSLADRPDLRHAMGTAAATDVADRFRIQTTIERYQRLYERNAPTSGI